MAGWLGLIVAGIICLCAAYYIAWPPPVAFLKSILMFFGVVLLLIGALLLVLAVLAMAGVHVPG